MKELSLNILDVAQNSVTAGADKIEITVDEQPQLNSLTIKIRDNGCGMEKELLEKVTDPFTTTRTTRNVGLGLPFFKMAAVMTGGSFDIESYPGVGTTVTAVFVYDNIDRMPLGDVGATFAMLLGSKPGINWIFTLRFVRDEFMFDSDKIIEQTGELDFGDPEIQLWLTDYFHEQQQLLYGGTV